MIKTTIGKITTSCLGKMLDKEKNKGDFQPYLANVNVRWGDFDLDNLSQMRFEPHEKERYEILNGDLIMCEGGEPGRCAIWRSELPSMKIQKALHRIRANDGTSIEYLYYWFLLAGKKHQLNKYFTGSTIKHLPGDRLKEIEIELPDYANQEKIAAVLSCIDNKIKVNDSVCADLEGMAKLLYDYWFVQFDFPDENGKPYKSSGGKMVWNKELKREIPNGWEVKPVLDIFDWVGTSQPPKSTFKYSQEEGYIRFIQNRDYDGDSHLTYIPLETNTRTCTETDIMIDKYGDAGKTRYGIAGAYNVALSKITVHDEDMREYVRAYLSSDMVYNYLHAACIASTRASLNEANFAFLSIAIPPKFVLHKFDSIATKVITQILELRKENQELASLRDFLLPMLMNGQVKIKYT